MVRTSQHYDAETARVFVFQRTSSSRTFALSERLPRNLGSRANKSSQTASNFRLKSRFLTFQTLPIVEESPSPACRRAKRAADVPRAWSRIARMPAAESRSLRSENGEWMSEVADGLMQ